jgi:hypothetical protein
MRFDHFSGVSEKKSIFTTNPDFMNEFLAAESLLNQVGLVVKNHEKNLRVSGNGFSFIHALGLESNEARFHTRLIGYLLNPKEGHFQGDKFLKLFFETIGIKEETEGFIVEMEKHVGKRDWENIEGGRIDLFISNSSKKVGFALELKVYAGEQEKQLQRYYKYLIKNFKSEESKVYFLTLEGGESQYHRGFERYEKISFRDDILKWIETCRLASVDQPVIRETLTQYIANIKRLTNQNPDESMNEDLIEMITGNENHINAYFSLIGTQTKIRNMMIQSLAQNLQKEIELRGRFKVTYSKALGEKDSSIKFEIVSNPSDQIHLYWLTSWGVVGIGLLTGNNENEIVRSAMFEKLSALNLGKYIDLKNWVWLRQIDSMAGKPRLLIEDWKQFKSERFCNQVIEWVDQIADAYKEVKE